MREAVAVVGLGLMGGSVTRALSAAGTPVRCWSPDPQEVSGARALPGVEGIVGTRLPERLVDGARGILLAVPLGAVRGLLAQLADLELAEDCWIVDVSSLQAPSLRWAEAAGLATRFVPAHPLVGGEASGFEAGREDLYREAPVFLSHRGAPPPVQEAVAGFWSALQARPRWVDAQEHDTFMGWVSHLPQVVATHLAAVLVEAGLHHADLGPGGRGMVRLAGSSPRMWGDILARAPEPVSDALRTLARHLEAEADALSRGNVEPFLETLDRTRDWRRK